MEEEKPLKNTEENNTAANAAAMNPVPEKKIIPADTTVIPETAAQQQTKEMETHAHHLHHAPGKKFWHYFYEFLMLFLAVFCGFLAENIREHQVERNRETEYMQGMLEDLAADTATLNHSISFASGIGNGLDSLQDNLFDTDNADANTLIMYRQNARYLRLISTNLSDQTAIQLRNAGGMRLIRKREVANAISRYWTGITRVESLSERLERSLDEVSAVSHHIFNRKNYLFGSIDTVTSLYAITINPAAQLMTTDKNVLINYAHLINRMTGNIKRFYIKNLIDQKEKAVTLIQLIKKDYQL